jgi:AcrR family transcriptional regulator
VTRTERTRAALLEAALGLFAEQGFEPTTVAQIAERAGVSEMTFFRHFGTKDALLVDDPYDPLIAQAVAAADPALPSLRAAAAGVRAAWASVPEPDTDLVRDRLRLVAATPSLRAAIARASSATEDAVAEALRSRGTAEPESRVAAAATVAALNAALLDWAPRPDGALGDAIARATAILDGTT